MTLKRRWYEYLPVIGIRLYIKRYLRVLFRAALRIPGVKRDWDKA